MSGNFGTNVRINAKLSLNDRFKLLRQRAAANKTQTVTVTMTDKLEMLKAQQANAKNKRLALQMGNRPSVVAALRLKRKSIKQRLGVQGGVKARLSVGGIRGSKKRGFVTNSAIISEPQANSRFRLNRNNFVGGSRTNITRGIRGGRFRRGMSANNAVIAAEPTNRRQRGRGGARITGQTSNRIGNKNATRGQLSRRFNNGQRARNVQQRPNVNNPRNNQGGASRGNRGGIRGRFRGGMRGRGRGGKAPNKNQLDKELDSYMSKTKGSLDHDLDSYMADAMH